MTNSNTYTSSNNSFLDNYFKKGILPGNISMIFGKSRQTGKSLFTQKMIYNWKKANRQMKIKRILDIISKNS